MPRRVTIDDVARLAEVHKATVSRALNAQTRGQVNAETLKRVKKAARQLGYVPNAMARGLRTSRSMTIGVIIPDLMNPIFPPMIRGIERVLQAQGYTVLIANTDSHDDVEISVFESLLQRRVDGFILATGRLDDQPVVEEAAAADVPVVLVNRGSGIGGYPLVSGDNAGGIALAVAHLVELGHRNIVHAAGPPNFSTTRSRAEAFEVAATKAGVRHETVYAAALTIEAGFDVADQLLKKAGPIPTALVAGNDLVALGLIRRLRAEGLRCPEEMSVVGFNDMPFAEDFWPPLTTVHMPLREIGAEAARLLLRGIEAGEQDAATLTLPVSLVVRGSTGPARS
ncbi:LacI family transcriptional regulator [Mycolicibacterium chubuense]|uniref:HTH-type transcriptional repressor CytR n=1 Tax=Mycolicibacterium chubuense TaxID=1800 RepID=A0A0J6VRW4_MYCCU|nr:HTH-type transcriptional repressor CytR [Mycolicibacterium chubuense]ORA53005.1 LacI family transcriptional regulator [Mycolicibacterium chubuense]SPX97996.1 LacI family transcriptional regulator [Mycolicibacterium chubuense]